MSGARAQLLNDFLSLVLWRLTLARCTDVGEFLCFRVSCLWSFKNCSQKMKLHVISAVTGVAGVPERICSIIQARPCLLRSQALLDLIIQLSAEYHPVPDDVIAQDTE